eukprot:12424604-Karenia_brevis.AAC.1
MAEWRTSFISGLCKFEHYSLRKHVNLFARWKSWLAMHAMFGRVEACAPPDVAIKCFLHDAASSGPT